MKAGENITIKACVLRVEGNRLDAQTPDGQLIQTSVLNVAEASDSSSSHKAVLTAPENKSGKNQPKQK